MWQSCGDLVLLATKLMILRYLLYMYLFIKFKNSNKKNPYKNQSNALILTREREEKDN